MQAFIQEVTTDAGKSFLDKMHVILHGFIEHLHLWWHCLTDMPLPL
jgi:hypothetical protein